jgi:hypothetical protein
MKKVEFKLNAIRNFLMRSAIAFHHPATSWVKEALEWTILTGRMLAFVTPSYPIIELLFHFIHGNELGLGLTASGLHVMQHVAQMTMKSTLYYTIKR